ncbi:MAG: MarR family transcriptional regulator [Candidatus Eremiobacterota bacterium]
MEESKKYLAEEIITTIALGHDKLQKILLKSLAVSASNLKNMSLSQLNVLLFLEARDHVRMKDIGEKLCIKPSSVTNLVDRLIRAGLVERSFDPEDRRVVEVSLSEDGKRLIEDVRKIDRKHWEKVIGKIDEVEYEEILRVIKKFDDALREIIIEYEGDKNGNYSNDG